MNVIVKNESLLANDEIILLLIFIISHQNFEVLAQMNSEYASLI